MRFRQTMRYLDSRAAGSHPQRRRRFPNSHHHVGGPVGTSIWLVLRTLLVVGLLLLGAHCWTWTSGPVASETGRVLDEGQNEVSLGTFLVIPWTAGLAHGFSDGWELSGRVGLFGSYDTTEGGNQELPDGQPLYGASLGFAKSILAAEPLFLSASAELAAFGSSLALEPGSGYAARTACGVSAGLFWSDNVGLFLPVRFTGLVGNHGNRSITVTPGLGASLGSERLGFRVSANVPFAIIHYADDGKHELTPLPFVGIECGYRW